MYESSVTRQPVRGLWLQVLRLRGHICIWFSLRLDFDGLAHNPRGDAQAWRSAILPSQNCKQAVFNLTKLLDMSTIQSVNAASSSSGTQVNSSKSQLKTEDFIKMMITQLQNQDPMEPAKNQDLLAQMSQIGQLQTSTALQDSLKSMVLQNQIGSAGNLIGKMVSGADENSNPIAGIVTSVRVNKDGVFLQLDSGKELSMSSVNTIAPSQTTTASMPGA